MSKLQHHMRMPERVRMWSPWWLQHVLATERTSHYRTMDELRSAEEIARLREGLAHWERRFDAWQDWRAFEASHDTTSVRKR